MKTQAETDFNNPKERFGWAFRGIKYGDHTMTIADPIVEQWSEHLSACGYVHISEVERLARMFPDVEDLLDQLPKQQIHYQPPVEGQDHGLNAAGKWQGVDEPIQESRVDILQRLNNTEKAVLAERLREEGYID